jgi:hypothetical protein
MCVYCSNAFCVCVCVCVFFLALRGQSCDIMVLEEAAYIDKAMFFDVVAPLMLVEKTAVMAISSPSDEFNYYSGLLELRRPDGTFLFEQVRLGLACAACMDNGDAGSCPHMRHIIPSWLSQSRNDLAKVLYGEDKAAYAREVQGRIASSYTYCFEKQSIRAFTLRAPYVFVDPARVRTIYTGVDPHGGGEASQFAMASFCYQNGVKPVSSMCACFSQLARKSTRYGYKVERRATAYLCALGEVRTVPFQTGYVVLDVGAQHAHEILVHTRTLALLHPVLHGGVGVEERDQRVLFILEAFALERRLQPFHVLVVVWNTRCRGCTGVVAVGSKSNGRLQVAVEQFATRSPERLSNPRALTKHMSTHYVCVCMCVYRSSVWISCLRVRICLLLCCCRDTCGVSRISTETRLSSCTPKPI